MLIYDGNCGFCSVTAEWARRRLPSGTEVVAWQMTDLDAVGLTEAETEAAAWWVDPDGRRWRGHLAVGRALQAIGGAWGVLGGAMLLPPLRWLARPVYWLVARYRHKLPGGTDACRLPQA